MRTGAVGSARTGAVGSARTRAVGAERTGAVGAERAGDGWGDELQATFILGEELFLRFPELRQDTDFLMQLAYLQAQDTMFPSEGYPANVFYLALEIALNEKQIQPTKLASWLELHGFRMANQLDALNIFGDGQPAQVLHIEQVLAFETFPRPAKDVVIVFSGSQPGEYRLLPLRGTWLAYILWRYPLHIAGEQGCQFHVGQIQ